MQRYRGEPANRRTPAFFSPQAHRNPGGPPLLRSTTVLAALAALLAPAAVAAASVTYEDVAQDLGVEFLHSGPESATKFIEVTGSGVCFADFDGDGLDDLYFVNQRYFERRLQDLFAPKAKLFANLGDGFEDVTEDAGVGFEGWGQGCSAADYDDDGDLDLFVTGYGANALYRNDGPFRFTNVTKEAGLDTPGVCADGFPCWSTGSSWADVNRDGCLDLHVPNYVEWNLTIHIGNGPGGYDGQANLYYENRCDGTFVDRTAEVNLTDAPSSSHSKSFQGVWADYDRDGRVDLYVASDTTENSLFRQREDGTFEDVARAARVDDPRSSMGLLFEDLDGDGLPDLYVTHYQGENNGYYLNAGDGTFRDHSAEGALSDDNPFVGWGAGAIDFDHDGDLDLLVVNGHTEFHPAEPGGPAQERLLFRREADGRFTNVTHAAGAGMRQATVARGSAYADVDLDGDLDVAVANTANATANLLRASGAEGGFVGIQLRQPGRNAFAIGAEVAVSTPGRAPVTRIVQAGGSFMGQNALTQHFGLGESTLATVEVRWPDGAVETWDTVPAGAILRLERGVVQPLRDPFPPRTRLELDGKAVFGWVNSTAGLALVATDRGVPLASGVASTRYRVDGGEWRDGAGSIELADGDHVLEARSTDVAGNVEPVRTLPVRVDRAPPSTSIAIEGVAGDAGWHRSAATVTLAATDDRSGMRQIRYRIDDGPESVYAAPFSIGEGEHEVEAFGEDHAGNREARKGWSVRVDSGAPTTRLAAEGPLLVAQDGWRVTGATFLLLDARDDTSGVREVAYRLDGGPWTTYEGPFRLAGEDGPRALEWRARDVAGNEETVRSETLLLDNATPPPLWMERPQPARAHAGPLGLPGPAENSATVVAGPVPVVARAGPDVSGIDWIRIEVDGRTRATARGVEVLEWTWDSYLEGPGEHEIAVSAADGLGNEARVAIRVLVAGAGILQGAGAPGGAGPDFRPPAIPEERQASLRVDPSGGSPPGGAPPRWMRAGGRAGPSAVLA